MKWFKRDKDTAAAANTNAPNGMTGNPKRARRQSSTGNSSNSKSNSNNKNNNNNNNADSPRRLSLNMLSNSNTNSKSNSNNKVRNAIKHKKEFTTEGSMNFRLLAFAGGLAVIVTSIESLGLTFYNGNYIKVLVYLYNLLFGFVICILEGHFIKLGVVQDARQTVIDYIPALRYLWGRGVFYAFSGVLQLSELSPPNILSGLFLVVVGVLFVGIGWSTKKRLSKLKSCLENPNKLKKYFKKYDRDGDNVLDRDEFGELIVSITGEEMDEDELEGIFAVMDSNGNDYVTLEELLDWWKGFEVNSNAEEHGGYDLM